MQQLDMEDSHAHSSGAAEPQPSAPANEPAGMSANQAIAMSMFSYDNRQEQDDTFGGRHRGRGRGRGRGGGRRH